jgi:hypothetical protein
MKKLMILVFLLASASWLPAESFFTLRGVERVYPVVEITGTKVPKDEKTYIREALLEMTKELGIDTTGYRQRSLAVLVGENYASKPLLVTVRLIVGEPVRRLDSNEKIFGITYESASSFPYASDSVEENLEDAVDELLAKFADQYAQERGTLVRVDEKEGDLAAALGYETDFERALEKAKRQHKNVMLVLVSNFCPWCRKFEQQVLCKQEVNTLVHEKYVPVILNKEKDAFPAALNLSFTPIVHFIDPATRQSYHRTVGYNEREEFMHWLKADTRR